MEKGAVFSHIPGTSLHVDGFRSKDPARTYLLSHFHADHYGGISDGWDLGPIYCSEITGDLLAHVLKVPPQHIHRLSLADSPHLIDGHRVTLIDANHCPGAVMFLVERSGDGAKFLHTGDMRVHDAMFEHPSLRDAKLDTIFLDTTYCNAKHTFPPQEDVIKFTTQTVQDTMAADRRAGTATLFLFATYTIGKEKLLLDVARQCGCQVVVEERKLGILSRLRLEGTASVFTTDQKASCVQVVSWRFLGEMVTGGWAFLPDYKLMHELLEFHGDRFSQIVAFVPTGWTYAITKRLREEGGAQAGAIPYGLETSQCKCHRGIQVYSVPYSEHSNYTDLRRFVGHFRPVHVVPTVLGPSSTGSFEDRMRKAQAHFRDLIDRTANKRKFVDRFLRRASSEAASVEGASGSAAATDTQASGFVTCPSCGQPVPSGVDINTHLDRCLSGAGDGHATKRSRLALPAAPASAAQAPVVLDSDDEMGVPETVTMVSAAMTMVSAAAATAADAVSVPGQFRALTGQPLSDADVASCLGRAGGDLEAAVNAFFDRPSAARPSGASRSPKKQATLASFFGSKGKGKAKGKARAGLQLPRPSTAPSAAAPSALLATSQQQSPPDDAMAVDEVAVQLRPTDGPAAPQAFSFEPLANTFEEVMQTTKRIKIADLLTAVFTSILQHPYPSPHERCSTLLAAVYLSTNCIAPQHQGVELGVGGRTVFQVVAEVTGRSRQWLKTQYGILGDMGDVAHKAKASVRTLVKPKKLTLCGVFKTLHAIAGAKGQGSVKKKKGLIRDLLLRSQGFEIKYIVRILVQHLRIGATLKSVQTSLARALVDYHGSAMPHEEAVRLLKESYSQHPIWDAIIPIVVGQGFEAMSQACVLSPGVPLKPMLAKITTDLAEVLKRLNGYSFQADFKYDGCRAQIHRLPDGSMRLFSRHLEDVTGRYPDVIRSMTEACSSDVGSYIVDSELVAVDAAGRIQDFQVLQTRQRKAVSLDSISVRVAVFLFDMMAVNGESLLGTPLRDRLERLRASFAVAPQAVDFARHRVFAPDHDDGEHDMDELRAFLKLSFADRCEGLMIKTLGPREVSAAPASAAPAASGSAAGLGKPAAAAWTKGKGKGKGKKKGKRKGKGASSADGADAKAMVAPLFTYQPDLRCDNWLKVKKDYVTGMSDSLDLVPIGAWDGNGRKAGWFSPFLLAAFDPETEELVSVCKVMSGFTDKFYEETSSFYRDGRVVDAKKPYYDVSDSMRPQYWFEPVQVWEIKGANFTISPVHRAGVGVDPARPECGISMRFPRFIRVRDDKPIQSATTIDQICDMYRGQALPDAGAGAGAGAGGAAEGGGGDSEPEAETRPSLGDD